MSFEIIDFHTHPFLEEKNNICAHKEYCHMSPDDSLKVLNGMGISRFCGSVVRVDPAEKTWDDIRACNDTAIALRDYYRGAYIPGFHVSPDFVKESCEEIERMEGLGVHLIGELVPYADHWKAHYASPEMKVILDTAEAHHMIVSFHSMDDDAMDKMVIEHPNLVFVAAHPGEITTFRRHMDRMASGKNYYLDLSGTGLFRHGMLRHGIDLFGPERFLFGTDFPICNPAMYVGGVLFDSLLTDAERELIFAGNAKRLLNLD